MPLSREEKEAYVASMVDKLRDAQAVIFSDFRGLDVASISQLRRNLREAGAEFKVAKNTLTIRAFEDAGIEAPEDLLVGPTAITVLHDDLAGPSKVLVNFANASDFLTLKGGVMGEQILDAAAITTLSEMPTREELLSQFIGTIQAPMEQLVRVLAAPLSDFVSVLDAKVREEAGAGA